MNHIAMNAENQRLTELLDGSHTWPCLFPFKFIVPAARGAELASLIPEAETVETRSSSGGRYVAYTFHCPMGSGREVLALYSRVKSVPGLVSL